MQKIILTLIACLSIIGCSNQFKKENVTKVIEMENVSNKNTLTHSAQKSFYIKLNTIPHEVGLENYSTEAKELTGEIIKKLNGTDAGEYYLLKLDKVLPYTVNKSELKTNYLIVGGRFTEQPLKKDANQTVVNVAIVKDETLVTDHELNFEKAIFAGIGRATEIKK